MKKKFIFVAPIKKTRDFVHYAVHEFNNGELSPLNSSLFKTNAYDSGLPPSTLYISRYNEALKLKEALEKVLTDLKKKGTYEIFTVNGYVHTSNFEITLK
jgi:hypothetical protein